ncbi:MAG: flagellar biosynthesis protein FlgD [Hyphomonas sp.]|jgi:flagellar basal-body rod modification protein FlgD|nr:flagellar biosynthesis protein FlgD [Henriciella sp.]MBO6694006.1 flagellar biosynthesis protein FlgD [Henriciella sp.]MCR9225096.1 flagellar biosynthesis protein FlgD [Hyphomonas sp.]
MTEVNPAASTGATTTSASSSTAINTAGIGEEFNNFLQLLTAQIKNQDPLSPLDSTQFVEQLATFSSLEQQVKTNVSLEGIASMIGDLHAIVANDWLGQEVAVASKHVAYEGKPVEFEVNPSLAHDQAVLTVTDSQNNVVWQEALDASSERHSWDGTIANQNAKAASGIYQFQLDLFKDGQPIAQTDAEFISKVTALGNEDGKLVLGTENYLTGDLATTRKISPN